MPQELVDFAERDGCAPINDFFARPGMVNPPYAYGWLAGDPEDSAVFWCKKALDEKPYKLMFKVHDPKRLAGCPATIEWHNPPGGLTIETRRLALRDFRDVTEPSRPRSNAVVAHAKVIVDYYDGLTTMFYCHEGRWLTRSSE